MSESEWTVGFELETFDESTLEAFEERLRRAGFYEFIRDGSGPLETASPPYPLFSRLPNPYAVAMGVIFLFDESEMLDGDDYDDPATCGNHVHVSRPGDDWVRPLFKYMAAMLPLFQPFFSLWYEGVSNGRVWYTFTSRRLDEWARPVRPSDIDGEPIDVRHYWAVTPNPSDAMKPITLEVRLCETWPLVCIAAIGYLVAGFAGEVTMRHDIDYEDSAGIPVETLKRYLMMVEAVYEVPLWMRRIAWSVASGKRPRNVDEALEMGVLKRGEVVEALAESELAERAIVTTGEVAVGNARALRITTVYYIEGSPKTRFGQSLTR